MCGLVGVIGNRIDMHQLRTTAGILKHRGPDNLGVFQDPDSKVSLAHTRLSIIDLETGNQPLFSQNDQIVLICNGEIYDFERIRASLQEKGYQFKTKSDSEVIINLYLEYGLDLFQYLRGEFAFILFDKKKKKVVCARDRFGIKPLFVSKTDTGAYIFASEIKAIFASGFLTPELDVGSIFQNMGKIGREFKLPSQHDDRFDGSLWHIGFCFRGIGHVSPGTFWEFDLKTKASREVVYWQPDFLPKKGIRSPGKDDEYISMLSSKIEEAVRLRLRSDVPLGVYLSGGVDSSLVAAVVYKILGRPPAIFTVSFPDAAKNEAPFAREMADLMGAEYHELEADTKSLWDNYEKFIWHCERPEFVEMGGKMMLSELASAHVKVVLTGEGSDETFLGYPIFRRLANKRRRHGRMRNQTDHRKTALKKMVLWLALTTSAKAEKKRHSKKMKARRKAINFQTEGRDRVTKEQYQAIIRMPGRVLGSLGDRAEMAHGIEGRLPLLDHELFELSRTFPLEMKIRGGVEKFILREVAKKYVSTDAVHRKKLGYAVPQIQLHVPLEKGFHASLDEMIDKYLSKTCFRRANVFSYSFFAILQFGYRLPIARRLLSFIIDLNELKRWILAVHVLFVLFVSGEGFSKFGTAGDYPAAKTYRARDLSSNTQISPG